MEPIILLLACALVYGLAWGVVWLIERIFPLPKGLSLSLAWFLFHLYLVGGLFVTGDLPGAPRAILKLFILVAGMSLAVGLVAWLRRRQAWWTTVGAWELAGLLPWALALLAEALG